jgi:hypothetical protein
MDIVERLRKRKAYNAEYDFDGNEIIGDDPDEDCIEAADEIERLRGLLKKDPNVYMIAHEDGDHKRLSRALVKAHDEIERLREEKKVIATHGLEQIDEIQRLREALNNILAVKYYGEEGGYLESDSMRDIARAALKGDE